MAFAYLAIVFTSVELVLAIINLLLVAIPSRYHTSNNVFCPGSISDDSCFAPLLYPFCLALITIIVLVIWLSVVLSGRILPTADYGSSFLGAACWYAAGGVAIHVVVSWERLKRTPLEQAVMKAELVAVSDSTVAPGSWYAAIVFCMLLAVVYTIDSIAAYTCPNAYAPPPAPGVARPVGWGWSWSWRRKTTTIKTTTSGTTTIETTTMGTTTISAPEGQEPQCEYSDTE